MAEEKQKAQTTNSNATSSASLIDEIVQQTKMKPNDEG